MRDMMAVRLDLCRFHAVAKSSVQTVRYQHLAKVKWWGCLTALLKVADEQSIDLDDFTVCGD